MAIRVRKPTLYQQKQIALGNLEAEAKTTEAQLESIKPRFNLLNDKLINGDYSVAEELNAVNKEARELNARLEDLKKQSAKLKSA